MKQLRVTAITIRDVLGAREFAIEPGRITTLAGKNAKGKSTVLQAVQAALGRGALAKIARIPEKHEETPEPEVVLVLEGDSEKYRVERSADKVRVRKQVGDTAGLEDVPRPQEFLASLVDATGASPVRFLQAADKDRVQMLLEALPIAYDREKLLGMLGPAAVHAPDLPPGLHPLQEIGLIRDGVFRARTGVNRDQKGKAEAAEQTRRNTPAEIPEDVAGEITKLEAEEREASAGLAKARADLTATKEKAYTAATTAYERELLELKAEFEKRKRELEQRRDAAHSASDRAEAAALKGLAARELTLSTLRQRLATLREQEKGSAKALALRDQAEQFDQEAEELKAESVRLTGALAQIDAYRAELLEDCPIPGLSIEDGELKIEGIPYDQQNTAERVRVAVQVATLRAKEQRLPLVFVDGAEALDSENFEHLCDELKAQGVQAFIGRVTDDPLVAHVEK